MGQNESKSTENKKISLNKEYSQHKGLSNFTGENNCFLNVILQSLWHLNSFRLLIVRGLNHKHNIQNTEINNVDVPIEKVQNCILCALKDLFTYYKYGEELVLDPTNMRIALDILCSKENKFQLGKMDDATELLDTIIKYIHSNAFEFVNIEKSIGMACNPSCVAHQVFEIQMLDLHSCQICEKTLEPELSSSNFYRLYVAELLDYFTNSSMCKPHWNEIINFISKSCSTLSKDCIDINNNINKCTGKTSLNRFMLKLPLVFTISLVWPSLTATDTQINIILDIIQLELDISTLFRLNIEENNNNDKEIDNTIYLFRGMVCYYGKHYVSFFFSKSISKWFLFDDNNVKVIGNWEDLCTKLKKGLYQPTLLFWENKNFDKKIISNDSQITSKTDLQGEVSDKISENISEVENNSINREWACNFCTFLNDINLSVCDACGNLK